MNRKALSLLAACGVAWVLLGANVQQAINFVSVSGITGLGTGVATALGINVGSAGAVVTNGGALGTPASGTATNITGLPIAGITGLGTGINTFLGTTYAVAPWIPVDASGAALTFTGVSANYTRVGNMVFAYATLTYPSTADVSGAAIGDLPVAIAGAQYARQCSISYSDETTLRYILPNAGSLVAGLYTSAGVQLTNAAMSLNIVTFICTYPAA